MFSYNNENQGTVFITQQPFGIKSIEIKINLNIYIFGTL